MERIKPIVIRFGEDEEYTLDFNRESIAFAEDRGFQLENAGSFPMTKFPELFYYAMRANHRETGEESDGCHLGTPWWTYPEDADSPWRTVRSGD